MTAATVHGVPITSARAAACRELLAGVASRAAWEELAPLVAESKHIAWGVSPEGPGEGTRHPPFGEPFIVEPPTLRALASCALGTACARCGTPIEAEADAGAIRKALETGAALPPLPGEPLDDGWCCAACVARQRAQEAFRRRAATWLQRWTVPTHGGQLGLFGVAPKGRRKARA